jgi:hypothetical protein
VARGVLLKRKSPDCRVLVAARLTVKCFITNCRLLNSGTVSLERAYPQLVFVDDCASSLDESAEQLSTSAEANRDVRTALLNRIDEFMSSSFFPGKLTRIDYGSESEDEATEERFFTLSLDSALY